MTSAGITKEFKASAVSGFEQNTDSSREFAQLRQDFPALQQKVHGKDLVYFDNAATTQKPQTVIDAISHFYEHDNANIHRGVHSLSERATAAYEAARSKVQHFLNARHSHEIIFVRGATEAINLVAQSYGLSHIGAGDEIIISHMEHHANIVPWQMLAERVGARLRIIPISDQGELDLTAYRELFSKKTKFVSLVHVSNSLGTVNPVAECIAIAHEQGVPILIDGAQAVNHMPVDVQALDADFYVFSGHKLFAPTGIGILYGKADLLESMPPYQGGGDMIRTVSFEKTTYNDLPYKFEAGTPHIAGAIGLGAAVDYLSTHDPVKLFAYEHELLLYAEAQLREISGLRIIGQAAQKASVVSFVLEGVHPHDIGTILDHEGIAIRAGHHCTMPIMQRFQVPATARASFAFYNTKAEIDRLVAAVHKCQELLAP